MIQVSETEIRERIRQLHALPKEGTAQEKFIEGIIMGLEWALGLNDYSIGTVKEIVRRPL